MYKPESVLVNETHTLLWNYEIQTVRIIRRSELLLINLKKKKRTSLLVEFAFPADHGMKIKASEKRDKY